mgnify:CR=1 FL=1
MTVPVKVYNQQLQPVAFLENATKVGYELPLNNLWKAQFTLPADDPKNTECKPLYFVEIFDGDERIDLFRIVPHAARRDSSGQTITYQCEHVLATLLDDVLFQFHQIGNLGVYTRDVLEYILSHQLVQRWQLGTVAFSRQFEYSWENENLLAALFSVPKPFTEAYQWMWDTTSYPWTLNLVEQPAVADDPHVAYIRYGHNMREIEREIDPTTLCTRLYCLGFGEGVNQLTIAEVNGGKPYLDADTQAQYGIISKIFVDRRFEHAETLKARGEALLEELKHPRITYRAKAADLGLQKFRTGSHVIVKDEELGIDITARVVNVRKPDITGAPGDVEIEIANRPLDIAGSIAELADRQRINEVYAQGATNFDSHDFADNCDPDHPAVLRFWIPQEAVRINKVMLSYECQPFRAYERAIESAPATTSGPSSITTTGPSSITTTGPSSRTTSGPSSRTTTAAGGGLVDTSTGDEIWRLDFDFGAPEATEMTGLHNHGIPDGTQLATVGGGAVTWSASGQHRHGIVGHRHEFTLPDHVHGMDHTHQMEHTHDMPHTHGMDHTHQIPSHTHGIEFGIYEGPTPTAVTVTVDGNAVTGLGTSAQEIDIIPYLAKDGSGKIQRGRWAEIKIAPNSLGRVVASVVEQIFISSQGGGNF